MRLYDTLTDEIRPLELRDEGHLSLYACGPTVYDHPHLGHARQAMTYDIIRRYLEWTGIEVLHAANVTDIDDNIINRATSEGSTEPEIAATWKDIYDAAIFDGLDILRPHVRPHATEYVEQMVSFVETLVDNDSAYANDSGVYLRVAQVDGYGALVHRSLDDLREGVGARVEVDENKEDPLDFALWKAAKPGEPTWPSPWGDGRPGWHIECVAMSLDVLGDGFDLHGGGTDLVFPHHTNERAEAIAAGRHFARHWMHNAMLNIDGEKMSKSLNNFRTIQDLLDEHPLNGRALRLLLLQTHYRKTMEINADVMAQARGAIERLDAMARKADAAGTELSEAEPDEAAVASFRAAMDDDMGTPEAVATIFETVRRANVALDAGEDAAALVITVIDLAGALGVRVGEDEPAGDDDGEIDGLVTARTDARAAKDFAEADRLRDELTARGIVVEDTPTGPVWHRS
ncbi:MAG: cysteine--tRNA ligase [Acidimicrobiales bacterium]|jgi:cysteinyl-tRNA synthetase|nr:cysteine--tRNA ligase [Acidimicrobiales bacterium]